MLNFVRAIVDTVRQCELRYRSVAMERDAAPVLNVGHLIRVCRAAAPLGRVGAAAGRGAARVARRDEARVHFALLWRQLHPSGDERDGSASH
jgi:hypothetical protein